MHCLEYLENINKQLATSPLKNWGETPSFIHVSEISPQCSVDSFVFPFRPLCKLKRFFVRQLRSKLFMLAEIFSM